jgi:hypothetical protein
MLFALFNMDRQYLTNKEQYHFLTDKVIEQLQ